MNIIHWVHHLFNPHCEHCEKLRIAQIEQKEIDNEINKICSTCEVLKIELAKAHQRIDKLMERNEPEISAHHEQSKQVIQTHRPLPSQIRQRLEEQSRLRAADLRANLTAEQNAAKPDSEIEKLEKDIKLDEVNAGN